MTRLPVASGSRSFVRAQRAIQYGYQGTIPFWDFSVGASGQANRSGLVLVRAFLTGEEPGYLPGAPKRALPLRGDLFGKDGPEDRTET